MKTREGSLLEELPDDLQYEVFKYVNLGSAINLSATGGTLGQFFTQSLSRKLRQYVAYGRADIVQAMLTANHPQWLLEKEDLRDYSGRLFMDISAFQYAIWALDDDMWRMMLDRIHTANDSDKIRKALLEQYQAITTQGVTYKLNGKTYHEKHYDFSPLISALEAYYLHHCHSCDIVRHNDFWCKEIGGLQRNVPTNVAQHYCTDHGQPEHAFKNAVLQRRLTVYDWQGHPSFNWFPLPPASATTGLGIDLAVSWTGGIRASGVALENPNTLELIKLHLDMVAHLSEVKTQALQQLEETLASPIMLRTNSTGVRPPLSAKEQDALDAIPVQWLRIQRHK